MIDGLATRYGCLPSEVLARGDVFDIFVIETVWSWEQYQEDKEKMDKGELTPTNQKYFQNMIDQVKGANNARKNTS